MRFVCLRGGDPARVVQGIELAADFGICCDCKELIDSYEIDLDKDIFLTCMLSYRYLGIGNDLLQHQWRGARCASCQPWDVSSVWRPRCHLQHHCHCPRLHFEDEAGKEGAMSLLEEQLPMALLRWN